jgi:hypothetical protein
MVHFHVFLHCHLRWWVDVAKRIVGKEVDQKVGIGQRVLK